MPRCVLLPGVGLGGPRELPDNYSFADLGSALSGKGRGAGGGEEAAGGGASGGGAGAGAASVGAAALSALQARLQVGVSGHAGGAHRSSNCCRDACYKDWFCLNGLFKALRVERITYNVQPTHSVFVCRAAWHAVVATCLIASCPDLRPQTGSLGTFGSMLGDKAAEVTAMAQQRFGDFGDYLPTSALGSAAGACGDREGSRCGCARCRMGVRGVRGLPAHQRAGLGGRCVRCGDLKRAGFVHVRAIAWAGRPAPVRAAR